MQKIENFHRALDQLEIAADAYSSERNNTLFRDALIQRFEFTVELAWKSLKEYIEDQGAVVLAISSPRAVLKEAFSAGYINDDERWNKILTARNITSHVYDEDTANEIAAQILTEFIPLLRSLSDFYKGK